MFEVEEIGRQVDKDQYEREVPGLRVALLHAQYQLRKAEFPVILVMTGDDRHGVHEAINILHEWMDPRTLETNVFDDPSDEELERPEYWRYWRALPGHGRIGIFAGAWTLKAIVDRMDGDSEDGEFERALEHIVRFETALADDGALILKFWLHLGRKELAQRLKGKQPPRKRWSVHEIDRRLRRDREPGVRIMEHALRRTSTAEATWHIVESTDSRYRNLKIGKILREEIEKRLPREEPAPSPVEGPKAEAGAEEPFTILDTIDLTKKVEDKQEYQKRLRDLQRDVNQLTREAHERRISSILVFEGWDAAGKGGVIRRLAAAMDAWNYRVISIAAPTEEERDHHYLWRFWRHLPRAGHVAVFDRSWYGRVLVERVEGFASETEWKRAYSEMNHFEEQVRQHGSVLLKFWLHIDKEEQLRRFKVREATSFKKYKITREDYRNRERWNDYERAVNEMVGRTSTEYAPWHLIPANNKRWARLQVLERYADALKAVL